MVYLREACGTVNFVEKIIYPKKGIPILNGDFIQFMIVNTYPNGFNFLLHE